MAALLDYTLRLVQEGDIVDKECWRFEAIKMVSAPLKAAA